MRSLSPPAKILERELGAGDLLSHLDEPDQVAELALVEPECGHRGRRRRGRLRDSRGPGGGARCGCRPRGPRLTDFLRSLQQVVGVVRIPGPLIDIPGIGPRQELWPDRRKIGRVHELGPRTRHALHGLHDEETAVRADSAQGFRLRQRPAHPSQDEHEGREAEPCHAHSILEQTTLSI